MKFNQNKSIKNIEKYVEGFEKKTSSQSYKPFFTIYCKQRHWLNPLKYFLGEYKFNFFEKDKQPPKYENALEALTKSIKLDTKDIKINSLE